MLQIQSDHVVRSYWWGVKHTFYTDSAANAWAHTTRMLGHANASAAVVAAWLFAGFGGVPNGLTAVWCYAVADSVNYYANKPGAGVILDLTYLIVYQCKAR